MIDDISIEINDGDMVSIIGPNGAGKSTIIKLISGELIPTNGNVYFMDKDNLQWDSFELAQHRSILSQSNNLTFPFSVLDIVKMGRYPFELTEDKIFNENICKELIDVFDLSDRIDQNYTTLSGGEKQRVQLARVLAQIYSKKNYNNKLLILDEPTSYLDINHQYSLFKYLKKLNKEGLTIVMVLHDLNHAVLNSNKMIMLKDSKIIEYGDTSKILSEKNLMKVFNIELNLITTTKSKEPFITFINEEE